MQATIKSFILIEKGAFIKMKKQARKKQFTKSLLAFMLAATILFCNGVTANANVMGIDVSRWNGSINWNEVAAAGVTYAFIRVGTTVGGVDMRFHENVTNAQAAGIRTGVYIYSYASNVEEAINEAHLVLQWIENYNINFPIAYDIEDDIHHKLDPQTITAMCNAFCDVIASAGYHPIVYTGAWFYKNRVAPGLRYDKWIAHYYTECGVPDYDIWQASNTGSIPGVTGAVDIDYMATDYRNIILPYGFAQKEDGVYFYNNYRLHFGWLGLEDGRRFHLGPSGRLDFGWFSDESGVYYLSADGSALMGQHTIDGNGYIFNEQGMMMTGWQEVGPHKFYYNPLNENRLHTGWLESETGTHYMTPEGGYMLTGLHPIGGQNFYFDNEGRMQTGIHSFDGPTYYFSPQTGAMTTGWVNDDTGRYYFSTLDGTMLTGLHPIENQIFYFDSEGRMQTGIHSVNGPTYYFSPQTGAMTTGWVTTDIGRYYFSTLDGTMLTGLHPIENRIFYFDSEGQMQTGIHSFDGLTYYFDTQTGAMTTGWITDGIGQYYFSPVDGHMLTNETTTIDNVPRCFAENGYLVANGTYTINGVTYVCDESGIIVATMP